MKGPLPCKKDENTFYNCKPLLIDEIANKEENLFS